MHKNYSQPKTQRAIIDANVDPLLFESNCYFKPKINQNSAKLAEQGRQRLNQKYSIVFDSQRDGGEQTKHLNQEIASGQQIQQTKPSKKKKKEGNKTPTPSGTNHLYEATVARRRAFEKFRKEELEIRETKELEKCTFKPNLVTQK